MNVETFIDQMNRLFKAFGYDYEGTSQAGQRQIAQVSEWYKLWIKIYPETTEYILTQVIDQCIRECKRVPSFAELREIRAGITLLTPVKVTTDCPTCRGFGHLEALKAEPELYGPAHKVSYAFRCNVCENHKGRLDGIPMWREQLWNEGFKLKGVEFIQL